MTEKEKHDQERPGKEKTVKAAPVAKAAKPAAKKSRAKKPGEAKDKARKGAEKPTAEEEEQAAAKEEAEVGPDEEGMSISEEEITGGPKEEKEEKISEEEFRRLVEKSLERVTVADIVLTTMNQMASVGYLKMGLPESVNLKYRDFGQARLAIDTLEAMLKAAEGKVPEEALNPFRGTLANLQLNFVQLKSRAGGN